MKNVDVSDPQCAELIETMQTQVLRDLREKHRDVHFWGHEFVVQKELEKIFASNTTSPDLARFHPELTWPSSADGWVPLSTVAVCERIVVHDISTKRLLKCIMSSAHLEVQLFDSHSADGEPDFFVRSKGYYEYTPLSFDEIYSQTLCAWLDTEDFIAARNKYNALQGNRGSLTFWGQKDGHRSIRRETIFPEKEVEQEDDLRTNSDWDERDIISSDLLLHMNESEVNVNDTEGMALDDLLSFSHEATNNQRTFATIADEIFDDGAAVQTPRSESCCTLDGELNKDELFPTPRSESLCTVDVDTGSRKFEICSGVGDERLPYAKGELLVFDCSYKVYELQLPRRKQHMVSECQWIMKKSFGLGEEMEYGDHPALFDYIKSDRFPFDLYDNVTVYETHERTFDKEERAGFRMHDFVVS
tara:strand:+ start:421 stop:1671 length:1251 start_codon:yes stop_codon:yes gene_type:complete